MTVTITISGENSYDAVTEIRNFASTLKGQTTGGEKTDPFVTSDAVAKTPVVASVTAAEPEKKTRKAKEEKVAEPKAEVLPPEKPKYVLQDAIDRAREIAGDGSNEKIMIALKGINTRLGISKVREIPAEKLDGYMEELDKEFPRVVKEETANMFD